MRSTAATRSTARASTGSRSRPETAHWLEWQDWGDPIVAEPFVVKNGHVVIPDRPGSGLAWNEDAITRYRYDV
jgi:L-alanine-DL-glutamate epimerase-like enolase superfamily enzyme